MTRRTPLAALARALLPATLALGASSCDRAEPRAEPRDVAAILSAAIEAHGLESGSPLEHVTIRASGRFRERVTLRSTIAHSASEGWSVDALSEDGVRMRFGIEGERCWREDRRQVRACTDGDRENYLVFGEVTAARLGHGFEASRFVVEEDVSLDGEPAPALRAGELVYVFHPDTHRLAEVRHGEAVEALHGYTRIGGVLVATRRTMTIGGEPDVEDHWEEIVPSQTAPAGVRAPAPPSVGALVEWEDPARWVAWTEVGTLAEVQAVVRSLEQLARSQGAPVSAAEGVVLTALHEPGASAVSARWRVAITLESGEPWSEGAFHIERWPAQRALGIYVAGDPRAALGGADALRAQLEPRGLMAAPDARWQILAPRQALSGGEALSLLRIAVQSTGGADPRATD